MRKAIREKVINKIPELNGRVYEPHMAGPNTEKPYVVVRMGTESPDGVTNVFSKEVQLWVYAEPTSFSELDRLVHKIRKEINNASMVTAHGFEFSLRFIGTVGDDFYDTDWKALGQGLRFEFPLIHE